jgi:hypothetical protein
LNEKLTLLEMLLVKYLNNFFLKKLLNLAPFYPGKRDEGWWCIVGDPKTNHLLAIKHITLQQKKKVTLEVVPQKVKSFFLSISLK